MRGRPLPRQGWSSLIVSGWTKTLIFIVLAPLMGMVFAMLISLVTIWLFRGFSPRRVDKWFRRLQLLSAAAVQPGPRHE